MVSRPELGSNPSFGSGRESRRDRKWEEHNKSTEIEEELLKEVYVVTR